MPACPPNRRPYGPLLGDCFQVERDSLEAMRAAVAYHGPERIAAIITEPVLGAGGVFPPPPGYLQGLRELCDECGALLIFDEVITAFGRLGSWFGAHHYDVTPDVITCAKAVTSGYLPLGGVVVGPRLRGWLEADDDYLLTHGGTYAGHPELLRRRDRQPRDHALRGPARAGAPRRQPLARRPGRARGPPGVAGIRGEGLMQAVALQAPLTAGAMVSALLTRGIISRGLPYANSIAFSPPLIISDGEIDEIVEAVDAALADVAAVV